MAVVGAMTNLGMHKTEMEEKAFDLVLKQLGYVVAHLQQLIVGHKGPQNMAVVGAMTHLDTHKTELEDKALDLVLKQLCYDVEVWRARTHRRALTMAWLCNGRSTHGTSSGIGIAVLRLRRS